MRHLVSDAGREVDPPPMDTGHPAGHIRILQRPEDVAKLLSLHLSIEVCCPTAEAIQLLILLVEDHRSPLVREIDRCRAADRAGETATATLSRHRRVGCLTAILPDHMHQPPDQESDSYSQYY